MDVHMERMFVEGALQRLAGNCHQQHCLISIESHWRFSPRLSKMVHKKASADKLHLFSYRYLVRAYTQ